MEVVLFLLLMLPDGGYHMQETHYMGPQSKERCIQVGEEYVRQYPSRVAGYICR